MDRTLLLKYLKFLEERAEALLQKDQIDAYDIAALQRELSDFRMRFDASAAGSVAIAKSIESLRLKATEADVEGKNTGALKSALACVFGRGVIGLELERKRLAAVKGKIRDFREEVSHLVFLLLV